MSRHHFRLAPSLIAACTVVVASCSFPSDSSRSLKVAMDAVPLVALGDSVQLTAHLERLDGSERLNGAIAFTSSAPTIAAVDSSGRLRAIGRGEATITARSVEYAAAGVATQVIRVRDARLDIDSVRPLSVRSGEELRIYGAGLDLQNVIQVVFGGDGAPLLDYTPLSGADGVLRVIAPLGQPGADSVQVYTALGTRTASDVVVAQQVDYFEPNDAVAADIGPLDSEIKLAWMVFETGADTARDWYQFENPRQQNVEVVVASPLDQAAISIEMRDAAGYAGTGGWLVNSNYRSCALSTVLPLDRRALEADAAPRVSISALPAGTYYVRVQAPASVAPVGYTFRIDTSLTTVFRADAFEEDDNCAFAPVRTLPIINDRHTIDHPTDVDWVRFSVASNTEVYAHISPDTLPVSLALYNTDTSQPAFVAKGDDSVRVVLAPGTYSLSAASRRSLGYRLDVNRTILPLTVQPRRSAP